MSKATILLFFIFFPFRGYCQNDIVNRLSIKGDKIAKTKLKGSFDNVSGSGFNSTTRYKFDNKTINLTYIENHSTECDSFILFGKKISIQGKFEDDLACHLDVTSFEVYSFSFKDRKYILVQSIKEASGLATSYIIFHLFDITNKNNVLYFPLWSVYGSPSCFADFDKDGKLDFLTIRDINTAVDSGTYKATLSSLDYKRLKFRSNNNGKYITFRRTYNKKDDIVFTILKKKW